MSRTFDVGDVTGPPPAWSTMLRRACRRRCPRCGERDVFRSRYHLRVRCPGCGYRFEREPGFFLGAWFLNFMVIEVLHFSMVMAFIIWKNAHPESSVVWPLGLGVVTGIVVPIVFYPWSQTLWAACDLGFTPLELVEIVEAADAVEAAAAEGGDG